MKKILFLLLLMISGCKQELYSDLEEKEANQMLSILLSNNIDVDKLKDKDGLYSILVHKKDIVKSINELNLNGMPKKKFVDAEQLFPGGQLVTSPVQEKARLTFLKEQNIERLISIIPGVLNCNVALFIGDDKKNTAISLIIISSPTSNFESIKYQIRELVKNSIGNVHPENITIVIKHYQE